MSLDKAQGLTYVLGPLIPTTVIIFSKFVFYNAIWKHLKKKIILLLELSKTKKKIMIILHFNIIDFDLYINF